MAKGEVSFALIFCFLYLSLLVSSPAAFAAPSKDAAKKDSDGYATFDKNVGLLPKLLIEGPDHYFWCNVTAAVADPRSTLVRQLCNATGHYNLCVAAVEADPRSNLKSHRKGILRIVMDTTISNATVIKEYIDHLLADNSTKMENTTRDSLKACSDVYDSNIYDFKHAFSLLELKNVSQYSKLSFTLNGMFGTPSLCDQIFIHNPVPAPYPLTSINNCVQDLSEACALILDIVYHKKPKNALRV